MQEYFKDRVKFYASDHLPELYDGFYKERLGKIQEDLVLRVVAANECKDEERFMRDLGTLYLVWKKVKPDPADRAFMIQLLLNRIFNNPDDQFKHTHVLFQHLDNFLYGLNSEFWSFNIRVDWKMVYNYFISYIFSKKSSVQSNLQDLFVNFSSVIYFLNRKFTKGTSQELWDLLSPHMNIQSFKCHRAVTLMRYMMPYSQDNTTMDEIKTVWLENMMAFWKINPRQVMLFDNVVRMVKNVSEQFFGYDWSDHIEFIYSTFYDYLNGKISFQKLDNKSPKITIAMSQYIVNTWKVGKLHFIKMLMHFKDCFHKNKKYPYKVTLYKFIDQVVTSYLYFVKAQNQSKSYHIPAEYHLTQPDHDELIDILMPYLEYMFDNNYSSSILKSLATLSGVKIYEKFFPLIFMEEEDYEKKKNHMPVVRSLLQTLIVKPSPYTDKHKYIQDIVNHTLEELIQHDKARLTAGLSTLSYLWAVYPIVPKDWFRDQLESANPGKSYSDLLIKMKKSCHDQWQFYKLYENMETIATTFFDKYLNLYNFLEKHMDHEDNPTPVFQTGTIQHSMIQVFAHFIRACDQQMFEKFYTKFEDFMSNCFKENTLSIIRDLVKIIVSKDPSKSERLVKYSIEKIIDDDDIEGTQDIKFGYGTLRNLTDTSFAFYMQILTSSINHNKSVIHQYKAELINFTLKLLDDSTEDKANHMMGFQNLKYQINVQNYVAYLFDGLTQFVSNYQFIYPQQLWEDVEFQTNFWKDNIMIDKGKIELHIDYTNDEDLILLCDFVDQISLNLIKTKMNKDIHKNYLRLLTACLNVSYNQITKLMPSRNTEDLYDFTTYFIEKQGISSDTIKRIWNQEAEIQDITQQLLDLAEGTEHLKTDPTTLGDIKHLFVMPLGNRSLTLSKLCGGALSVNSLIEHSKEKHDYSFYLIDIKNFVTFINQLGQSYMDSDYYIDRQVKALKIDSYRSKFTKKINKSTFDIAPYKCLKDWLPFDETLKGLYTTHMKECCDLLDEYAKLDKLGNNEIGEIYSQALILGVIASHINLEFEHITGLFDIFIKCLKLGKKLGGIVQHFGNVFKYEEHPKLIFKKDKLNISHDPVYTTTIGSDYKSPQYTTDEQIGVKELSERNQGLIDKAKEIHKDEIEFVKKTFEEAEKHHKEVYGKSIELCLKVYEVLETSGFDVGTNQAVSILQKFVSYLRDDYSMLCKIGNFSAQKLLKCQSAQRASFLSMLKLTLQFRQLKLEDKSKVYQIDYTNSDPAGSDRDLFLRDLNGAKLVGYEGEQPELYFHKIGEGYESRPVTYKHMRSVPPFEKCQQQSEDEYGVYARDDPESRKKAYDHFQELIDLLTHDREIEYDMKNFSKHHNYGIGANKIKNGVNARRTFLIFFKFYGPPLMNNILPVIKNKINTINEKKAKRKENIDEEQVDGGQRKEVSEQVQENDHENLYRVMCRIISAFLCTRKYFIQDKYNQVYDETFTLVCKQICELEDKHRKHWILVVHQTFQSQDPFLFKTPVWPLFGLNLDGSPIPDFENPLMVDEALVFKKVAAIIEIVYCTKWKFRLLSQRLYGWVIEADKVFFRSLSRSNGLLDKISLTESTKFIVQRKEIQADGNASYSIEIEEKMLDFIRRLTERSVSKLEYDFKTTKVGDEEGEDEDEPMMLERDAEEIKREETIEEYDPKTDPEMIQVLYYFKRKISHSLTYIHKFDLNFIEMVYDYCMNILSSSSTVKTTHHEVEKTLTYLQEFHIGPRFTYEELDQSVNILRKWADHQVWKVRFITLLIGNTFRFQFFRCDAIQMHLDFTALFLGDENTKVHKAAMLQLIDIYKFKSQPEIQEIVKSKQAEIKELQKGYKPAKTLLGEQPSEESKQLKICLRHLHAIVFSPGYDIPEWLPDLICYLAQFNTVKYEVAIRNETKECISSFKKRHIEDWKKKQKTFSDQQLDRLQDVFDPYNYYA